MNFSNQPFIHLSNLLVGMTLAVSLPASAGMLTGTIKDTEGNRMEGVLVRVTDDIAGVSESVYTDPNGVYKLITRLNGTLKLRARTPYYKDTKTAVEIPLTGTNTENLVMSPMTNDREISESLPAAYHFGGLPFESGDDKDFNRYQFQRDCLSCHQLGNAFTRQARTPESWAVTIERMHRMLGNFDAELRQRRSVILSEGFDGKPIKVRPEFPLDPTLSNTKIYEYMLDRASVPHDAIAHPTNGLIYTVDTGLNHIVITDPATGQSRYVNQPEEREPDRVKTEEELNILDAHVEGASHGPHSLDLRPQDGKYYVTNSGNRSIGVFNPQTERWEPSHFVPAEMDGIFPHTIRVNKKGNVWFTLAASEYVGRLDPETGKFNTLKLPDAVVGGVAFGTMPYGIDINPTDDVAWYARLFGDKIGAVDPDTLEITEYDSPVRGPRRIRFDQKGFLWITGYSEGQLARVDVSKGFESVVYDMPAFAPGYTAAPYALGVHPDTQDIWLNENMTDRIYRFIPSEERWIVYPVPLSGTYSRDMTFTADGQVCLSNNPLPAPVLEGGVLQVVCIDTNYHPDAAVSLTLSQN